jgi:hypothetical protein
MAGSSLAEGLQALVETRHRYPLSIQYFTPEVDRIEAHSMLDDENPDTLEDIITAIQRLELHSKLDIHEWGVNFFLKDISGYLRVDYTGSDYVAEINYDKDTGKHKKVKTLARTLKKLGFEE